MYKWNKKTIKTQLNYLKSFEYKQESIEDAIEILKSLNNKHIKEKPFTQTDDIKDINDLKELTLLNQILSQYYKTNFNTLDYKKIITSSDNKIIILEDIIREINKDCYNKLKPIFNNKNNIDINKNNDNYVYYIEFLNNYYISLSQKNDITDFTNMIHEFMHIYSTILNEKSYYRTDNELLSIFSELVLTEELKKRNLFSIEPNKAQINDVSYILEYIHEIIIRKNICNDLYNIKDLKNYYNYSNKDIKHLYSSSFNYISTTTICYFIAIELFKIYKNDKEKAIYIIENIIKSDEPLFIKLSKNNIYPLTNSDSYIKQLKKEYITYNQ